MGLKFLRIELLTNDRSLKYITKLSHEISNFLDESDLIKDKYILDVYSAGLEEEIEIEKLNKYINKKIKIELNNMDIVIGKLLLLNKNDKFIEFLSNNKGRIIKKQIKFNDINKIKLFI